MVNRLREDLTAQELRICALVAEGLTNQQAAERLHLTHWTVKTHVARILRKTGATNRMGIADLYNSKGMAIRTTAEVVDTLRKLRVDRRTPIHPPGSPEFYRQQGECLVLDQLIRQLKT
jgi:DNA-binding CsgD family transcriptional regulator